jgi:hypothetical protein
MQTEENLFFLNELFYFPSKKLYIHFIDNIVYVKIGEQNSSEGLTVYAIYCSLEKKNVFVHFT